jgi:cyclopropane-fatty-acyl-phospholipid synthase
MSLIELCERGLVPDPLTRFGIRRLCARRLDEEGGDQPERARRRFEELLQQLRHSPVAIETAAANAQHYELPPRFFELCLGARMKYSSCYYATGAESLDEAEEAMLELYGERAQLADGQRILELGCGWGSLTLWMAARFPKATITAVSNSASQREHIEAAARARGLRNIVVLTRDVNSLELQPEGFDRCVSIEMFEHMRNYDALMARIAGWLAPGGRLFVHIFCHRTLMYPFETTGEDDWMGRHFFTGGLMPSADTLLHFQQHLRLEERWLLPGTHYQRTANHWLERQDANRRQVLAVLREAYGDEAARWHQRWRMFWMACAELFGYRGGEQWLVGHYRFAKGGAGV